MRPTNTYRGARRKFMRANKLTWSNVKKLMPVHETLSALAHRRKARAQKKEAK